MFLSSNDNDNKINELKLYSINITDYEIKFFNDEYKIRLPLKDILFVNQHIYFRIKEIHLLIDHYYKEKFYSVLEKIKSFSKINPYINENGYVLLTSNKLKNNRGSHYFKTHNAILLAPSQKDITNNPSINVIPILDKITCKLTRLITSKGHIIEQQNFDSSYKFNFVWKSELSKANKLHTNNNQIFASLNKEGVYIASNQKSNTLNSFIQATRYDQFINCQASEFRNQTLILNSNNEFVRVNNLGCCIEYDVNWYDKPYKEMFCSKLEDKNLCLIEINYFKHFMFRKCMENGIEILIKEVKNNFPTFKSNMTFLNILSMYSLIINLKTLEKYTLLNDFNRQLCKSNVDFNLLNNHLDVLFVKSLQLVKQIDVDDILRNDLTTPSDNYLTNKYVRNKYEELNNKKGL